MSETEPTTPDESLALMVGKAAVLCAAALLLSWPMAGAPAVGAAVGATALAVVAARLGAWARLRTGVGVLLGLGVAALALPLDAWISESTGVWGGLSSRATLIAADVALFGGLAFGVVFTLRTLAARARFWSVLEAAAVVAAVSQLFARHRNLMINRPRWLSDWALTQGLDPQVLLQGVGVLAAVGAVAMTLRRQRPLKLALTLMLLLGIGGGVYLLLENSRIDVDIEPTAGLSDNEDGEGKDNDGDGKPDDNQGGGGAGDGLGDGSGGAPPPRPNPVAVAVFHEDYDPPNGLYYFRQQVLSRFDGMRLSVENSGRFDQDVLTTFPSDAALTADETQVDAFHTRVPATMFLLVDHPQPLALTASVEVKPHHNPAPRRFVAAYDAVSLTLSAPVTRLVGRPSVPADWSPEKRAHYLEHPDDPRYAALADELVREVDPRFAGDDLVKALAIKQYLEREGFYTRKERHLGNDPTGSFLFGSMRGYCVHFAHAAANLFRSQGIAARVAVGYAVDAGMRGAGSAVLILGDRAHAWPEIHIAGVGWIPFDIYPEQSDEPPPRFVDQSLESLMGELARGDPTGGRGEQESALVIPWAEIGRGALALVLAILLLAYAIKLGRLLAPLAVPARHRWRFAATLDRLSDIGHPRLAGETRERHAARLGALSPSFEALTQVHLRLTLGRPGPDDPDAVAALSRQVLREVGAAVPWWRRALGWLNPIGWWFTR